MFNIKTHVKKLSGRQKMFNVKTHVKKLSVSAVALASSAAYAAPVELPASASADVTGSISNGGGLAIAAVLAIVGFAVILRMMKKI